MPTTAPGASFFSLLLTMLPMLWVLFNVFVPALLIASDTRQTISFPSRIGWMLVGMFASWIGLIAYLLWTRRD